MSKLAIGQVIPLEYDARSMRVLIEQLTRVVNDTWDWVPSGRIMRTAAPTAGTWKQGTIVWNESPSAGGTIGWVCAASGTPGTWGTFGHVSPTYRDITGSVITRGVGATDPDWTQIGSGPFYAYAFALNDVCWISFHVPHDYIEGTDIFLHTHWLPSGTNANSVKWSFDYMYAKGHNQAAFNPTGTTITAEQSPPGTAYQHMVTETAAFTVSGMEPDGILYVKMTRVTNGGTDNTDTIFVLTLDVHYQSNNSGTKNRAPDFYT